MSMELIYKVFTLYHFVWVLIFYIPLAHAQTDIIEFLTTLEIEHLPANAKQKITFFEQKPEVIRLAVIRVDKEKLITQIENEDTSLTFFEDTEFLLHMNFKKKFFHESKMYSGMVFKNDSQLLGSFTFTTNGPHLALQLQYGEKLFSIRAIDQHTHLILEINPRALKEDVVLKDEKNLHHFDRRMGTSAVVPEKLIKSPFTNYIPPADLDWEEDAVRDNGNTFDMMVVYSSATENLTPDIVSQIKLAVSLANTAYFNSQINTRMRLVYIKKVDYTETNNFNTELTRLASGTDGFNDDIQIEKATYRADFVAFVSSIVAGLCGLAQLGQNPPHASRVYSVTETTCITNHTFAHEVGHNLGNDHASPGSGIFAFSHGFFNNGGGTMNYRTIMSTSNECAGCPRQNFFSNASQTFAGVTSGDSSTADVRHSINIVASAVSEYEKGINIDSDNLLTDSLINKDCFIATAAYGTRYHKDISVLRHFRDRVLVHFWFGQKIVSMYNRYSPPLAHDLAKNPTLRKAVRWFLAPLIFVFKYPVEILMMAFALLTFGFVWKKAKHVY